MKVVQVLTMDQQVQHIVPLSTDLKTYLNPVKGCSLKKFRCFERAKQVSVKHHTHQYNKYITETLQTVLFILSQLQIACELYT
jgi:hypothetical protein